MKPHLKNLKRSIFILPALIVPMVVSAQKMEKPQIDKFTNDTVFFTTTEKVAANKAAISSSLENIEAYTSKLHGNINLHLKIELSEVDHHRFHVEQGSDVMLKLGDNTVITKPVITNVDAQKEHVGSKFTGWACWTADVAINLTQEDIAKISASGITAVRVSSDKGNLDFDVKPKYVDIIKNMVIIIQTAR